MEFIHNKNQRCVAALLGLLTIDLVSNSLLQYFEAGSFNLLTLTTTSQTLDLWLCSLLRCSFALIYFSILRSSPFLQMVFSFNWAYLAVKCIILQSADLSASMASMLVSNIVFSIAVLYLLLNHFQPEITMDAAQGKNEVRGGRLLALEGLRAFAAIHIVLYHITPETNDAWGNFVSWGGSQLTLFFSLSGFILAYRYGNQDMNVRQFLINRFFRIYPLLWLSIALILPILKYGIDYQLSTVLSVVISSTAWDGNFSNDLNEPAWFIGAIMFCYILFPALVKLLKPATNSTRTYNVLPLCYLFSAWAAMVQNGDGITVWYNVNRFIFATHAPEFAFGIAMGLNFLQREPATGNENLMVRLFGTSLSLWTLAILMSKIVFDSPYMQVWQANGLLLPLYGGLIWSLAADSDMISKMFKLPVFVELGKVSFSIYILQAAAKSYMFKFFVINGSHLPYSQWPMFFTTLLAASFIFHYGFANPISEYVKQRTVDLDDSKPFSPRDSFSKPVWSFLQLVGYVLLFVFVVGLFSYVCITNELGAFDIRGSKFADTITVMKWVLALGVPSLLMNVVGQIFWPAPVRRKYPTLDTLLNQSDDIEANDSFEGRLHVRIVTRGKNPTLVLNNAEYAVGVLRESELPEDRWVVEVVTDNALFLAERSHLPIVEILVPAAYVCPNGGKYKARALHYAIEAGNTRPEDWIVHLDEETRFNLHTINAIYAHCKNEHELVKSGQQEYCKIGQGVILYGTHENIDNYVTTLADCVRVGDDFGKFRFQYEFNRPWIGMHGSFVVANHVVEETFGFDHGIAGSITEDAYFALNAWADGVHMAWIDAFMFEQSPFTVIDFVRQRARWFGGLYLVCRAQQIPFKYRACLSFTTLSWACSPLICIGMFLSLLLRTDVSMQFRIVLALCSSLSCFGYVLGYFITFDMKQGLVRYLILLYLVLLGQPLFALMEIAGILYTFYQPPSKGFFVVQKEQGKPNLSNCDAKAITQEDLRKSSSREVLEIRTPLINAINA